MPVSEIPSVVRALSLGKTSWDDVCKRYPKFEQQESTAK